VGTGTFSYTALNELDIVTIVQGIQGGWHVTGAARVCNMVGPNDVVYTLTHEPTGTLLSQQTYLARTFTAEGNGCEWLAGMIGFIDASSLYTYTTSAADLLLDGDILVMDMSVTDSLGDTAQASLRVTAWDP
jgi:hypothetical protein